MRTILFLFLLLPLTASATTFHYEIQPDSFFYVHDWQNGSLLTEHFDTPCLSGTLLADDELGIASILASYDGGTFDVSAGPSGSDTITTSNTGDIRHVGPGLAGTVEFNQTPVAIVELSSLSFSFLSPGLIYGNSEWAGWFGGDLIEWGIDFNALRTSSDAAVTPEPASILLLGAGLLGASRCKRKR